MPRTMTMQETQQAIDRDRRQIAKWDQQIAAKQQQLKADANLAEMYSRKARTHRLCKRGAMLEKFLRAPDLLTDDQVLSMLRIAFAQKNTQDALMLELDRAKFAEVIPEQKPDRRNYTPSR